MAYRLRSTNNMLRRFKRSGTDYKATVEKSGFSGLDQYIKLFVDKSVVIMNAKGRAWADKTLTDFKANVPVDTGNLRDSISIREDNNGYAVGVDQDKLIGPKKLRSQKSYLKMTSNKKAELAKSLMQSGNYTSLRGKFNSAYAELSANPTKYLQGQMRYIPPYNYVPFAERNTKQVGASGEVLTMFTTTVWRELARRNARSIFR